MKDGRDKRTGNLLMSPGAKRQAEYVARQREAGRRQCSYWLTENEAKEVAGLLERLRHVEE